MTRRTVEEIREFTEAIYAEVPHEPEDAQGIVDIAKAAKLLKRGKWTRTIRRQVNEALVRLRDNGRIIMVGQGRATKYYRAPETSDTET